MKTSFTTYTMIICLTVLAVAGISHAGEKVRVFEMADGNIITFKMTAEEIAAQEAARAKLKRTQSALRIKPKKNVLEFEMVESGITFSFPLTKKELAEQPENPDGLKRHNTLSKPSESRFETVELPETGFYLFFPVSRDDNDETEQPYFSQKPQ